MLRQNDWQLDRAADLRTDDAWLHAQMDNHSLVAPVWRGLNLFSALAPPEPVLIPVSQRLSNPLFLGVRADQVALFAANIVAETEELALAAVGLDRSVARFIHLRSYSGRLLPIERSTLFYARSLALWHEETKYCARCGTRLQSESGGHVLGCPNPACGAKHFPRSDPATIMLVHQHDRCLLGRQSEWPEGMYSTLAGFAEIGETLEEAVRREVREESGIIVENICYFGSQPWPFPRSLMLGFFAEAITNEIVCGAELEDARWFSRGEAESILERLGQRFPHLDTIARRLIRHWVAEQGVSRETPNVKT